MAVGKLMYCMASLSLGLKMKNKKTREWKRDMERKWRDKEMEWMKELAFLEIGNWSLFIGFQATLFGL
ncbi:hypothetical protein RchiOBHm_Chr3g0448771 [Rosa chinensis]|uniref:Uncharacterized protein n=1 Tax=Rosa chinensis TaxID=74649 RepID=A0A2P6R5F7_ROSCH|nr:hypothetical protein RchiOBHm_Chr3g0448771 [Rosa chinensis]